LAEEIAAQGVREIVLTGVNIGDFGVDGKDKFIDLIRALDAINGIERYRISSIEPNLLTDEVIRFVAHSQRFVPHFHVPLQSGSDALLKMMRRKYDVALYRNRIQTIRQLMPDACIGVDVIVGFPGETDEEFQRTYDLLEEMDVSYLHVFTYSERPNTGALKLDGVVPVDVRRKRSRKLQLLSNKKKRTFYQRFEGSSHEVLFEQVEEKYIEGFTRNYLRVRLSAQEASANELKRVKLGRMLDDVMTGQPENEMIPATVN
jgi:threonylcarbamoyladenosine tRNA methylthiotransferase MtaB